MTTNKRSKEEIAESSRKYYMNNRDKMLKRARDYYREHKEEVSAKRKKYYIDHQEKTRARDRSYNQRRSDKTLEWHRKKNYGITQEEYDKLNALQNGLCAICGKENVKGKSLGVDHDHITGEIRGLLCQKCNLALGNFEDNIEFVKRAISYLEGENIIVNSQN
jgi:hypothetical protein